MTYLLSKKGRAKGSSLQNTKKGKSAHKRNNTVKERRLLWAPGVVAERKGELSVDVGE
jgi:hypothetical protein